MTLYLLRRLFLLGFVLLGLSVLAFSLAYLFPGDVLENFTGLTAISAEQAADLRAPQHQKRQRCPPDATHPSRNTSQQH